MEQLIVVGLALIVVSVVTAAFMSKRRPAYSVVPRQVRSRSRIR